MKLPRIRPSLRMPMALTLLLGVGLGHVVQEARIQREAVSAILKSGGHVDYDREWKKENPVPHGRPWGPRWIVDHLSPDYFGSVVMVEINEEGSDAGMVNVGRLRNVEESYLHASSASHAPFACVTDAGMLHLAGLGRLRAMTPSSKRVGNAGPTPTGRRASGRPGSFEIDSIGT